jgi:hypothetical protein
MDVGMRVGQLFMEQSVLSRSTGNKRFLSPKRKTNKERNKERNQIGKTRRKKRREEKQLLNKPCEEVLWSQIPYQTTRITRRKQTDIS